MLRVKMKPDNFTSGRLSLWDKDELLKAESKVDPLLVTHLDICAKCYQAYPTADLLSKVSRYNNIDTLHLSDDFIPDNEMKSVKNKITAALNIKNFKWSHDLLVNGKHGR